MENERLVSVIVPVYNAEKTLQRCLDSLAEQTYPFIEMIFVNDCSTDNSLTLIEDFAEKWTSDSHTVKIFSHQRNMGVAVARNTALDNATGDYIYFVDADDFIERETIRQMEREMELRELDIVGIEWFLAFNKSERYMRQAPFDTANEALQNMMYGVMRWNLWLFMVKRSLFVENKICFTPGEDMGEDMMVVFKLFAHANNVYLIKRPLYHYGQLNEESLTKKYSEKHRIQVTNNVMEIERYLEDYGRTDLLMYLPFLKLNIKLPLLVTGNRSNFQLWKSWFTDADKYVELNPRLPKRVKWLQKCAVKGWYSLVYLYYIVVIKVVYGIIYK